MVKERDEGLYSELGLDIDAINNLVSKELELTEEKIDEAITNQASRFYYWSAKLVDVSDQMERAKYYVDQTYAQIDSNIRTANAANKPTEKAIENMIKLDAGYIKSLDYYYSLKHAHSSLLAAVNALRQKKDMIELLAQNKLQQWYANPRQPSISASEIVESVKLQTIETQLGKKIGRPSKAVETPVVPEIIEEF